MKKFLASRGLIPLKIKWRKSASGTGTLFSEIVKEITRNYGKQSLNKIAKACYNVGLKTGKKLMKEFKFKNHDTKDAALALIVIHEIYGMKGKIVKKTSDRTIIHVNKCLWKEKMEPRMCYAIFELERGICSAINPKLKCSLTKTRSQGNNFCEIIISKKRLKNEF